MKQCREKETLIYCTGDWKQTNRILKKKLPLDSDMPFLGIYTKTQFIFYIFAYPGSWLIYSQ